MSVRIADAPDWLPDDRVDCARCRHHRWESRTEKRPPPEPHLDPREHFTTVAVERARCALGNSPMAGRLRRCPDYREVA